MMPPEVKEEYVEICAARGMMGFWRNLCRQGH